TVASAGSRNDPSAFAIAPISADMPSKNNIGAPKRVNCTANAAVSVLNPGANHPTSHGAAAKITATNTANTTPPHDNKVFASIHARSGCSNRERNTGSSAGASAPDMTTVETIVGIIVATKKASVNALAPNTAAKLASRAYPNSIPNAENNATPV